MPPSSEETKQSQRTFLRERYLRMLTSVFGSEIAVKFCNKSHVKAKFGSSDVDGLQLQVNDLETPIGTQPSALVRTSDVLYVDFSIKG